MSGGNSKKIGILGEAIAADYLMHKGYAIIQKNYHTRYGEIDIIAENKEYIVFVEVKTRNETTTYSPSEAVNTSKQKRLLKSALLYLEAFPKTLQPRMDVIEVILARSSLSLIDINHIENAFFEEGEYAAF